MKRQAFLARTFLIVIVFGMAIVGFFFCVEFIRRFPQASITFLDGTRVLVEVVKTPEAQAQGLSGRALLSENDGMLFVYDEPQEVGIWMKDMRFPIDILWIRNNRIVHIVENASVPIPGQPIPSFRPSAEATEVLELRAGFAKAHTLNIGDPVFMDIP